MWHLEAEPQQVLPDLVKLVRIRSRMHPVQAGDPMPSQELGRLHVGRDHAFLDQSMRIVAWHRTDSRHAAFRIDHYPGLRDVQLESATPTTNLFEQLVKIVQAANVIAQFLGNRTYRLAGQKVVDLRIRQPGSGTHDRLVKPRARHFSRGADLHFTNHAQPVYLWLE